MFKRFILLVLVIAVHLPAYAQDDQTFSVGEISVTYPAGWQAESANDTGIYLGSSDAALAALRNASGDLEEGDIAISIFPADSAPIDTSADAQGMLGEVVELLEITGSIQNYPAGDLDAAWIIAAGSSIPGGEAVLYVLNFEGNPLLVAVQFGGAFEDVAGEIKPIIGAIQVGVVAPAGLPINQWASGATATTSFGNLSWNPEQATGAPDTTGCGDFGAAWASESRTGKDTLTLSYDQGVVPTQINIHQNYNPGSIIEVELITVSGETIGIPESADPPGNTECPGVFSLNVEGIPEPINQVVIHLDQTIGGNWNEIDAVELIGTIPADQPFNQWASSADGSSEYGTDAWGFAQATGEPNTTICGDSSSAWAAASSTSKETLAVGFDQPVIPSQINIHQTYNPGSIIRVELVNTETGDVTEIPESADPPGNTECPGVFTLNIEDIDTPVDAVIIYFDQSIGGGWNEIDAVELVGTAP